ncbi:GNAT family N-acetyltransferase [Yoonia sp. 208BN28-4]|uniref:GNAT family N-acetyltransferase n=1 Tax=Yoonia sp. 208BN28-4 TaxID=3126505 RepID=UPI00309BDDF0
MTAAITLASPDHQQVVLGLMLRCHEERGIAMDDAAREKALAPLLDESPLGAVWLIGPIRAPLGYVVVTFGWSVADGGMIGWIEDVFVRQSVRRRGIGTEVLHAVSKSLSQAGIQRLRAAVPSDESPAARLCHRIGLRDGQTVHVMSDTA